MSGGVLNYRVYFNRKNEAPQVFSVDEGDQSTEINVARVEGDRVSFRFHYDPAVKVNPDTPTAWMVVEYATLQVRNGCAHFSHDPDWRLPKITEETNKRLDELP